MSNGPPSLPAPQPPRALPVTGDDLLLILIVVLGSMRLLAGLVVNLAAAAQDEKVGLAMVLGVMLFQTVAILGAIHFVILRKYNLRWADLGLRPSSFKWHRRGFALALLLMPMVAVINGILIPQVSGEDFHNPQIYAVAPDGFSWPDLLSTLVLAGFVAPLGEELVFRGLLFTWLRGHLGVVAAAVVSGLVFGLLHGALILIPALAAIGTALALFYHRCGSLWPVILAHGAFNSIMVILLYAALAAGLELP